MEQNNIEIGLRIKSIREERGLTRLEFSSIIGVDNSTMGKIEKGSMGPTLSILLEISSNFEVSLDWLTKGGERAPKSDVYASSEMELLLKIYETVLNLKAHTKTNSLLLRELFAFVDKKGEIDVDLKYNSSLERFLSEELRGQR